MDATVTAATRIDYDPRTDLIDPTGSRAVGGIPAAITAAGYDVVSANVVGWGTHNAVIYVDPDMTERDGIGGYWLATLAPSPAAIRSVRAALGLSQEAFADRLNRAVPGLGTTPVTVSRWESGKHVPSGPAGRALVHVIEEAGIR